jgi:hypothetical protein
MPCKALPQVDVGNDIRGVVSLERPQGRLPTGCAAAKLPTNLDLFHAQCEMYQ